MSQTTVATTDKLPSRVSWGAIISGGLVAVTVGAMFNILGVAVGAGTIDPMIPGETPDASTFGIAGAIWLLVSNLLGLACGGYVAARLSGTADDTDGVLHGLSVWAIAFLVSAVLLGNVAAGTARGVGALVQGAASSATSAASEALPQAADLSVNPEALAERLQSALQSGGDPTTMTEDQRRAEITRILAERARSGSFTPAARDRLTALASAEFELPQDQAAQRIQELEAEATRLTERAETEARQAAEAAANAAATGAYWLFATLLLGAAAAVVGAKVGTRKTVLLATRRYS
ncbi:hypothetical protein HB662_07995 [Roseomonas frigidaquae]|uniref:PhnA-like protein n=1 Tax=Falsiroseomonas frigidaquae TaxID=487318 RepID=A0ABX1EX97_9PROT|nr:hypothetical protein [Falsiroseomonas frigidaquae]NKE44715.1 hypothetical protein [Falsiroseomonas frigidaquae]